MLYVNFTKVQIGKKRNRLLLIIVLICIDFCRYCFEFLHFFE